MCSTSAPCRGRPPSVAPTRAPPAATNYYKPAVTRYYQPATTTVTKYYQPASSQYYQPATTYHRDYYREQPSFFTSGYVAPQVELQTPAVFQVHQAAPAAFLHASNYASAFSGPQYRILKQVQEVDPSGPYRAQYQTENGITSTEEGALTAAGSDGPAVAKQGSYSYTGPDGKQYTVSWIADEFGFRAAGDHLPTPPPVPATKK
ncbi:Endocuticle structural glycoprotein SgAbd-2 [Frankliniella fusca]|uniref:Endocuticle structural glycoprotein SgAbd-2 n=1 Tax=Frankliniella fusca TaxID=407009 RepID=A0AAE1GVR6_9NEOP|nr:Endocuticle structural glycoprotein SgAbd-2 [Frankliniella fusca]